MAQRTQRPVQERSFAEDHTCLDQRLESKFQKLQPPHLGKAHLPQEAGGYTQAPERGAGVQSWPSSRDPICVLVCSCPLFPSKTKRSVAPVTPTSSGAVFSSSV